LWHALPDGPASPISHNPGCTGWPRPLTLLRALLSGDDEAAALTASRMSDGDWDTFTELAIERHRVAPAIVEALQALGATLPGPVSQAIRDEARANGFAALAQQTESLRLAELLEGAGIAAVWLKGWPLAEQLYGAPGRRHSNDIDLLVTVSERLGAAKCLEQAGYVATGEHRLRARLIEQTVVEVECKDVAYVHPETGLVVELHWRTNTFLGWPDLLNLDEVPVVLPGADGIRVPGPLGQLVYLSGHGQQHLFGRLKWLLDIARLAEIHGPARLAEDLARAVAAGSGRPVRLALYLAHRVFGSEVPAGAQDLPSREAGWAGEMLAEIADPRATPGRIKARLGFYLWHLRMAENPAQVVGVLRFAIWRRLRLGVAGLIHRKPGRVA
jgi:putative nucleotidyltransferase-like protein